jgi:hypothetical protein
MKHLAQVVLHNNIVVEDAKGNNLAVFVTLQKLHVHAENTYTTWFTKSSK